MTTITVPTSDIDLFAEDSLQDPYENYAALRALGGAVWIERLDAFAVPRYHAAKTVLGDWKTFTSEQGVTLNTPMNEMSGRRSLITMDPPLHSELRKFTAAPLRPKALRQYASQIRAESEALVDRLLQRDEFDGITQFAHYLPLTIVRNLAGFTEEGRERMLEWAAGVFDAQGPASARSAKSFETAVASLHWMAEWAKPPHLTSGGWAQMIFDAVDRGELDADKAPMLVDAYLIPSLDTTINATGHLLDLFGRHPEQFDLVRDDPGRIPNAINEVLRIESPIQWFTRVATRDTELDGTPVPAGSRLVVLYGSANRDDRVFDDPARFDVMRKNALDHLSFGFGEHVCVGQNLARLEIRSLLEALVKKVSRIEVGTPTRVDNQTLRGLASLPTSFRA